MWPSTSAANTTVDRHNSVASLLCSALAAASMSAGQFETGEVAHDACKESDDKISVRQSERQLGRPSRQSRRRRFFFPTKPEDSDLKPGRPHLGSPSHVNVSSGVGSLTLTAVSTSSTFHATQIVTIVASVFVGLGATILLYLLARQRCKTIKLSGGGIDIELPPYSPPSPEVERAMREDQELSCVTPPERVARPDHRANMPHCSTRYQIEDMHSRRLGCVFGSSDMLNAGVEGSIEIGLSQGQDERHYDGTRSPVISSTEN